MVLSYIAMNQPWVYMYSPSWTPSHFPPHPIPQGHPSAPALSTLSHALNLDWWSVSHMIIHMLQCYSLRSSHPCLLPHKLPNLKKYPKWFLSLYTKFLTVKNVSKIVISCLSFHNFSNCEKYLRFRNYNEFLCNLKYN